MIIEAIAGGLLIGLAASLLFLTIGRIAGISGIAAKVVMTPLDDFWPALFIIGLGIGGWLAVIMTSYEVPSNSDITFAYLLGGILVGFGTRLGSGCTSGHGVCGMARFSKRSIVATLTFVGMGMITATGISLL